MNGLTGRAASLSALVVGAATLLSAGALPAMAQQQVPDGWFKACTKQEEVDICNVQNIVVADSGQLVTGVSLIELKGKIKEQWGKLTDDEIDQIEGNTEILAGKLQERYGWERDEAERQVKDFSRRHGWQ